MNVLERIRNLRIERGWSEYLLAEKSGLTQSTISAWFRTNTLPTIPSWEKICSAFNLTPLELVRFGTEQPSNTEQIVDSLSGLTNTQLDIVRDFIGLVRNYKI